MNFEINTETSTKKNKCYSLIYGNHITDSDGIKTFIYDKKEIYFQGGRYFPTPFIYKNSILTKDIGA